MGRVEQGASAVSYNISSSQNFSSPDLQHEEPDSNAEKFIQFSQKYGKQIAAALGIFIILLVLIDRWSDSQKLAAQKDFMQSQILFQQLLSPSSNLDSIQAEVDILIAKHQELQAQFDGLLAYRLTQQKQIENITSYTDRALQRTKPLLSSPVEQFSLCSKLIANSSLEEALLHALALDKFFITNKDLQEEFSYLHSANLYRILILSHQTGDTVRVQDTWTQLRASAGFDKLSKTLVNGSISLTDFVKNLVS